MRKRSRRRSRRRSSRRGRRHQNLNRRIGLALIACLLGVGAYLVVSSSSDDDKNEDTTLGMNEVIQEHSPEAKQDRRQRDRAILREATQVVRTLEGLSGADRRAAEAEAYTEMVELLDEEMDATTRQKVAGIFNELTDRIFFSAERNDFSKTYIVESGDSIAKIANAHNTTQELLCLWNDIAWEKRAKINIGQSLKYVEGAHRVVVDKSEYYLNFYFGDKLARQFIIAHGKHNGTPVGIATVINKVVDPDIGENIADNHREMDERWIGLSSFGARTGIGIHGTKHQDEIPGETSAGCVRMFNDDVTKLYAWLPVGATVELRA